MHSEKNYFVGHANMHSSGICFRINSNSLNTKTSGGSDDTACNFSTICNQNFIERFLLVVGKKSCIRANDLLGGKRNTFIRETRKHRYFRDLSSKQKTEGRSATMVG